MPGKPEAENFFVGGFLKKHNRLERLRAIVQNEESMTLRIQSAMRYVGTRNIGLDSSDGIAPTPLALSKELQYWTRLCKDPIANRAEILRCADHYTSWPDGGLQDRAGHARHLIKLLDDKRATLEGRLKAVIDEAKALRQEIRYLERQPIRGSSSSGLTKGRKPRSAPRVQFLRAVLSLWLRSLMAATGTTTASELDAFLTKAILRRQSSVSLHELPNGRDWQRWFSVAKRATGRSTPSFPKSDRAEAVLKLLDEVLGWNSNDRTRRAIRACCKVF